MNGLLAKGRLRLRLWLLLLWLLLIRLLLGLRLWLRLLLVIRLLCLRLRLLLLVRLLRLVRLLLLLLLWLLLGRRDAARVVIFNLLLHRLLFQWLLLDSLCRGCLWLLLWLLRLSSSLLWLSGHRLLFRSGLTVVQLLLRLRLCLLIGNASLLCFLFGGRLLFFFWSRLHHWRHCGGRFSL